MSYINYFTGKRNKVATFYPKGTMTKDADTIYKISKNKKYAPGGEGSATRWLTYYLNRGGKGIKPKQRKEIEKARHMLQRDLAKKKGRSRRRSPKRPRRSSPRRSSPRRSSPRRSSPRRSRKRGAAYRWMSYSAAAKYIPDAKERGVSKVARGRGGFMGVYKRMGSSKKMKQADFTKTQTWGRRRENFIKRHMAQYKKNPTRRRWLALVMWAYKPPGRAPK
jgi:hypothetical protein